MIQHKEQRSTFLSFKTALEWIIRVFGCSSLPLRHPSTRILCKSLVCPGCLVHPPAQGWVWSLERGQLGVSTTKGKNILDLSVIRTEMTTWIQGTYHLGQNYTFLIHPSLYMHYSTVKYITAYFYNHYIDFEKHKLVIW